MPRLFRLLIWNGLFGFALGVGIAMVLIAINVAGLGDLLAASDSRMTGTILLTAGFGFTFASLAMGSAIMSIGRDEG